jgi:hypothetical protein
MAKSISVVVGDNDTILVGLAVSVVVPTVTGKSGARLTSAFGGGVPSPPVSEPPEPPQALNASATAMAAEAATNRGARLMWVLLSVEAWCFADWSPMERWGAAREAPFLESAVRDHPQATWLIP